MTPYAGFEQSVKILQPRTAVVLGSGQSSVLAELREVAAVPFAAVPGLGVPTVAGHSGLIIVGTLRDIPILVFQGRLHFYEGHSWEKVSSPIEFAASLGIKNLLLTNAAGGIHPSLDAGSMMIIRDHLFLQRPGAWRGPGPQACHCPMGSRESPYSSNLLERLRQASIAMGEIPFTGIYAALTGPCYETPAEICALKAFGVDAVGMSTAWEVETAQRLGLECAAISAITNKGAGLANVTLHHQDVLDVMAKIRERMGLLITTFLDRAG